MLEEALAPHSFMTIHTQTDTIAHFLRTGRLFVYEHPTANMSLSLQHIARRVGHIRVGLAFGSGSARGFAHVGVLKVLEKNGIPIDMIAGTSMGAFVGGFFAAGVTASDLEQMVLSYRDRRKVRRTIFDLTLPLYGLSKGTHLSKFMQTHLKDLTFDDLATPFAAVATDINTGSEVVLRHGTLWKALRASGSVPVMFEPYYLEDRYLVDGSITNPLPTDILIENDVDFIISCSVNSVSTIPGRYGGNGHDAEHSSDHGTVHIEDHEAKKCGIMNALARSMGIMSATNTTNKARLADIDIRPNVSYIDWTDFHRGDELLHEGEEAAEKALPAILELLRENRN
jgi:NTE family protein